MCRFVVEFGGIGREVEGDLRNGVEELVAVLRGAIVVAAVTKRYLLFVHAVFFLSAIVLLDEFLFFSHIVFKVYIRVVSVIFIINIVLK